ncbi:NAD-dependent epimerase/dehydratase family protein, partial [Halomonas sp.]|uniref:NAD-dependent epimerase/dehydratase family protein n=1 Tax=Halomonas sp. TaxID=1486246 RepID=UPI0025C68DB1
HDIRRPRPTKHLRMFDGAIDSVDCVRIAVLGTDGAIGKRTTSTLLTQALNDAGIHTVMVGTGQTGLMQGAAYGVALDAIPAQFGVGELEGAVVAAYEGEHPAVIVIVGQGALSHPAYLSSTVVLRASRPDAVIMQHAPARRMLSDYPEVPMPSPYSEIRLIELFGKTRVIGLAINHEDMTREEVTATIARYDTELGLPATDALWHDPSALVAMVTAAFPALQARQSLAMA